jgi:integrase/recombinase XerD
MIVTSKVFLDTRRQKADKTFPLKIRITVDRKHKEAALGIYLLSQDWDDENNRVKPSHPNAKLIALRISQAVSEVQKKALKLETSEKVFTADLTTGAIHQKKSSTTFWEFTNSEIEALKKAGKIGNAITYRTAANSLIKFTKNNTLKFEGIDYNLLSRYSGWMLENGLTQNASASYLREIRAIFNKAIKAEIVEEKYYPFKKFKIKTTKTISRALTIDEMQKIARLQLEPGTQVAIARDYFLLSFFLIGTNFSDIFKLRPSDIREDRVSFLRSKTHKPYSIYLHASAKALLAHYGKTDGTYLLPILKPGSTPEIIKRDCLQAIKTTNKYLGKVGALCGLKLPITTYYARYSWANIAKSLGYSKDLIAEALGHEYGNAVTGIYLDNYGNELIDTANKAVIDAVLSKQKKKGGQ